MLLFYHDSSLVLSVRVTVLENVQLEALGCLVVQFCCLKLLAALLLLQIQAFWLPCCSIPQLASSCCSLNLLAVPSAGSMNLVHHMAQNEGLVESMQEDGKHVWFFASLGCYSNATQNLFSAYPVPNCTRCAEWYSDRKQHNSFQSVHLCIQSHPAAVVVPSSTSTHNPQPQCAIRSHSYSVSISCILDTVHRAAGSKSCCYVT